VVSGVSNELGVIEEIVKKLDKADGQSGTARVFKLKTAEPTQVASMLSSALTKLDAYGRAQPRVSVGADARNSMLIVSGEPKDLQAAAVIIEQMDAAGATEQRQMRIIALKSGVASDVSTKLRQVLYGAVEREGGAADALILGDDASNRLIITATEAHLKLIEEIVKQFQEGGEGAGRQMRIIGLQKQSAASVAAMISQLFSRQMQSSEAGVRLTVTASPDDRTLVVDGPTQTFNEVEQLVKTPGPGARRLGRASCTHVAIEERAGRRRRAGRPAGECLAAARKTRRAALWASARNRRELRNSLLINGPNDDSAGSASERFTNLDEKESEDGEIRSAFYTWRPANVRGSPGRAQPGGCRASTVAQRRRNGRGFSNHFRRRAFRNYHRHRQRNAFQSNRAGVADAR
jgi:type II secretory pathway component GspD/PulD (secretin)